MFEIRIEDQRLNAYRVIKGHTKYDVEAKAAAQIAIWNERALRNQVRAEAQARRDAITFGHGQGADEAESLTEQVQEKIAGLEQLLPNLLKQAVPNWSSFQHHDRFPEKKPLLTKTFHVPPAPLRTSFQPAFTFLDKVIKSKRTAKEKQAADEYADALANWQQIKTNSERAQRRDRTSGQGGKRVAGQKRSVFGIAVH